MDPSGLIPAPDAIPVSWGWLEVLLLVTFTVHILLMNAVVGGTLLSVVRGVAHRSHPAIKTTGKSLPTLLALAVNFGVAPLLFVQMLYGQFLYTSSVLMATYWLSIVFILIAAYYGLYLFAYKYEWKGSRWILALSCVLMLCIAFFFTNNMTLMLQPERWTTYFTEPGGTILNTADPSLYPRWLHFMTAAVAVGGLLQAVLYDWKARKADKTERGAMQEHIHWGMSVFKWLSLAQFGVGSLFLFSLPEDIRSLFLGGSDLHTGALVIALGGVSIVLHYAFRHRVWPSVWSLVFTIFAMATVRALLREAYLAPYFSVSDVPVAAQYSPMIMFLISLVIGLVAIAYMCALANREGRES